MKFRIMLMLAATAVLSLPYSANADSLSGKTYRYPNEGLCMELHRDGTVSSSKGVGTWTAEKNSIYHIQTNQGLDSHNMLILSKNGSFLEKSGMHDAGGGRMVPNGESTGTYEVGSHCGF
jgi:hypothetical protein